jgi:hypothetical protein
MMRLPASLPRAIAAGAALLVTAGAGCSGDSGGPSGPCLLIRNQKVTTSAPAKVQVFFTVDTCTGLQPVTGLTAADIEVREDGSRVSALESQQRLVRTPSVFRSYSLLVLDVTASIVRGDQLAAVQEAARQYVATLTADSPEQFVGIYYFDGRAKLNAVQDFTNDVAALNTAIDRLSNMECETSAGCTEPDHNTCVTGSGTGLCLDDSTNLYGGVVEAVKTLATALSADNMATFEIGTVVLFSDGADQAGRVNRGVAVDEASRSSHFIYTVGVGAEADNDFLRQIGKTGTQQVATAADLGGALVEVAGKIRQQTGRHYLLEYCSPKRGGNHEVSVTVNSNGAVGAVTIGFSANGFTSGCTLN